MIGFTELEEDLLGDDGDAVLRRALEVVRGVGAEAEAALSTGLGPEDRALAELVLNGARAAETILLSPPKQGEI